MNKNNPEIAEIPKVNEKISPEMPKEEAKSIAKNETVASPAGIGEVRGIRNGEALIDIGGKLHKIDVEDLESEPDEVKEAKFDFDLNSIPELSEKCPIK